MQNHWLKIDPQALLLECIYRTAMFDVGEYSHLSTERAFQKPERNQIESVYRLERGFWKAR